MILPEDKRAELRKRLKKIGGQTPIVHFAKDIGVGRDTIRRILNGSDSSKLIINALQTGIETYESALVTEEQGA